VSTLSATPQWLVALQVAQNQDEVLSQVTCLCKADKKPNGSTAEFWMVRNKLSLYNDLLLCGQRIVTPASLRKDTPQRLYGGHQGIVKFCLL